jgi:hypothetical protein
MLVQVGPKAHLPSCTVGVGCFLLVQWPGCGADYPPLSVAMVVNGLELYLCLPSVPADACHGTTFVFSLTGTKPCRQVFSNIYWW